MRMVGGESFVTLRIGQYASNQRDGCAEDVRFDLVAIDNFVNECETRQIKARRCRHRAFRAAVAEEKRFFF